MDFDKLCGIASIIGVLISIVNYITINNPIHVWVLSITLIIFILLSMFSILNYSRACKYLECKSEIQNIHNYIVLKASIIKGKNLEGIIHELSNICTHISDAFTKLKTDKISVCIKYVNGAIENPYVKTLCRDVRSIKREDEYSNIDLDYIKDNTDFLYILKQLNNGRQYKKLYFFANKLANKHQYMNSHLKDVDLPSGLFAYYKRRKMWPLPYKSTIIVPFLSPDNKHIDAFLCIDSPSSNGFNEKHDVEILQNIALFMREIICYVCNNHLNQ